jgi:hypothetical protein
LANSGICPRPQAVVTATRVVFDNNGQAADIRGNAVVFFE